MSQERQTRSKTAREEAIRKYRKLAQARRLSSRSKSSEGIIDKMLKGQILIALGRMTYNHHLQRGVQDRSFMPKKVPLHKEFIHKQVLDKAVKSVWGEASPGTKFYLADASGALITDGDFEVELTDGSNQELPWTLGNYLKVSSIKYPSRAKLYCVRDLPSEEEDDHGSPPASGFTTEDVEEEGHIAEPTCSEDQETPPAENVPDFTPEDEYVHVEEKDQLTEPASTDHKEFRSVFSPPDGYFRVEFVKSRYIEFSDKHTFRFGLTQEDIVCSHLNDDLDRMHEAQALLVASPEAQFRLFPENPLKMGYFLESIEAGNGEVVFDFIDKMDQDSGIVHYKEAIEGTPLSVWTGCYVSPVDGIAILACPALGGHHSHASYKWYMLGDEGYVTLESETTPLLYAEKRGTYQCVVAVPDLDNCMRNFYVTELSGNSAVACCESQNGNEKTTATAGATDATAIDTTPAVQDYSIEELSAVKKSLSSASDLTELTLLDTVGQGTYGHVFKAVWRGSIVAAKEIATGFNAKGVENELKVYRILQHPNILQLLGVITRPTSIILVTNYVRGYDMHNLIFGDHGEAKPNYEEKVFVSRQVCQALTFMHTSSPPIAHLDLKPANILIEKQTLHVYVADFGLGQVLSTTRGAATATMAAGTPGFQAPEQLKGECLGISCDVYAFGGVLVEFFGEEPLWLNTPFHTIMYKVAVEGIYPSYTHLSMFVQSVVKHCLCLKSERMSSPQILRLLCSINTP